MLKDEIFLLKTENKELKYEIELLNHKGSQDYRKDTACSVLDLEKIRTKILFGEGTTRFQRFDN